MPRTVADGDGVNCSAVDRQLANKNLRTALVAGAISLVMLAASFLTALVY